MYVEFCSGDADIVRILYGFGLSCKKDSGPTNDDGPKTTPSIKHCQPLPTK